MIRRADPLDRLYLSQGEETIFIENCKIPPHHIEGIRFLFRQFNRKKPGVIINDPFGFGRNIQTILFIKAIRRLLTKPILIICQEGDEHEWVERFDTWTDLYHEVAIESTNPSSRKMIMINPMINLPTFCKRDWALLVVDGQKDKAVYQILKLPFRANFKIWNTPLNMKENLDIFADVYHWLYRDVFDKPYFIPDPENALDVFEKTILLDSFMEDIVIRRDNLSSSFEKYQRDYVMPPPKATTKVPAVPSKKNKDATGTKIKRSKGRVEELAKHESSQVHMIPHTVVQEERGESSTSCGMFSNTDDYSIENFKRHDDGDFLNSEIESQFKTIDINPSENSELKLYYESDPIPPNVDEINNRAFGSYAFDSPSVMLGKRGSSIPFTYTEDNLSESDDEVFMHKRKSEDAFNEYVPEGAGSYTKTSTTVDQIIDEIPMPNDDRGTFMNNKPMTAVSCDSLSFVPNHESMKVCLNMSESHLEHEQAESHSGYQTEKMNQSRMESMEDGSLMNTKQVTNNLKRNNIDDKIKECEAKVAKKFKGSFLDSLF